MGNIPGVLKLALILGILLYGIYGLVFLLIPGQFVQFAGGPPFEQGWLRWPGGILLAVAFGQFRVLGAPAHQGLFVGTVALGSLLIGLAILFSWVMMELHAYLFWIVEPIIVTILHAVLMYMGLKGAGRVLD